MKLHPLPHILNASLAIVALAVPNLVRAAAEDRDPQPILVSVSAARDAAMPLDLYRSLRSKLPGVEQPAGDVMALAAEVREHEDEILNSMRAHQSIQRELAARVAVCLSDRPRAVAALSTLTESDIEPSVRAAAAQSLGKLSDASAVDTLVKGLWDEAEEVRSQSVAALGQLRDDRAVMDLVKVLRVDAAPQVRLQAAISLGAIKTGVAVADLSAALEQEKDERIRMGIAAAIRAVTGSDSPATIDLPDPDDFGVKLAEVAKDMESLETKLRDERHDTSVVVEGDSVDRKISDMIKQLENAPRVKAPPAATTNARAEWQKKLGIRSSASGIANGQGPSNSGSASGQPGDPRKDLAALRRREAWAALPTKERDELLQVFRPEVPLRWRKRVEAYFLSIVAEETKTRSKKR